MRTHQRCCCGIFYTARVSMGQGTALFKDSELLWQVADLSLCGTGSWKLFTSQKQQHACDTFEALVLLLNNFQVFFGRSWNPAEVHWLSPAFLPFMEPNTQAVNASTHWPYISLAITGYLCRGPILASGLAAFAKSQGFTSCPSGITYSLKTSTFSSCLEAP